jgi:hypothetical protein
MVRLAVISAAALALCLAPAIAWADDAASPARPDYTLFNPTPDDQLRALCTDRPTKSTGACTVDPGHLQIESDLFNATIDDSGGIDVTTYFYTNPTFKLGLTRTIDVELNIAPFEQVLTRDRATRTTTDVGGIGDLYARLKVNLAGDDSGAFAAAIVPYVKAPTARPGLGDGAVEGGVVVPLSFNLPAGWSVVFDPEADVLKDADSNGRHLNIAGLASLSKSVTKTVTASIELWSQLNFDPKGLVSQSSFDLGAAWIPAKHPNVQLDGGVNLGLNRATPGAQVYLGLSRRF